jgi:hypothetical protein
MCRDTVSVRWDGVLFDCDFNQQLDLPLPPAPAPAAAAAGVSDTGASAAAAGPGAGAAAQRGSNGGGARRQLTVWDIGSLGELEGRGICTDNHCFGCTAGFGSGCQGASVDLASG